MKGTLVSIQIGRAQHYKDPDKSWRSAIRKVAVDGPVQVRETSLAGDEQADREHHGGADKAVLAYSMEHYPYWSAKYPHVGFEPGGFGENLTVSGVDEATCCIGDSFKIGECFLQVSQPRQPCWKLSRRWGLPELAAAVQKNGRSGWSTLSRNVRVMEENGWLRSEPVASGVGRQLRITGRGERLYQAAAPAWRKAQKEIKELLGKDGTCAILRAVAQVRESEEPSN